MASGGSKVWTVFSLVSALAAAGLAKTLIDKTWSIATGKKPPENPADPDVNIAEAIMWAMLSGTAIGLARMLAQRHAAKYYKSSTGRLPPELAKDDQQA